MIVPAEHPHVTVGRHARPAPVRGVRPHYADLADDEVLNGVTTPLRTALDRAATLPWPEALAIADSALRDDRCTPQQLAAAAGRQSGPARRRVRRVARWADARAANPFESCPRAVVLDAGLTSFVPQLRVDSPGGSAYADLGDPELRPLLEADSFTFHGTRTALERDCRRYDGFVRAGWTVPRFSWEQVLFDRDWVARTVLGTATVHSTRRIRPPRASTSPQPPIRRVG
jgi:very-short-patch-repair endonuclease